MSYNKKRILIVDDDAFSRVLLTTSLEEGYRIETAENGRQALQRVTESPFDLVLLDLSMPEMDGYEVLTWMKNNQELQFVPVMVISGESDMGDIIRSIEMGAMDYIPKPFDPVLLRARVRNALRVSCQGHEATAEFSGRVLVADDDFFTRTLLVTSLQDQGYLPETAENGREAIDKLHAEPFDVALIDLLMPEMDGLTVLKLLKRDVLTRDMPVIMISGESDVELIAQCIEMGAEDYLSKPFEPTILKARIAACLEKKRLRDQELKQQKKVNELNKALKVRNQFIQETFGRYLSDDIVHEILESPKGWSLGGEKRTVTLMMTDLRGFTSIGEQHPAEKVVRMLNIYFDVMVEVLFKHKATIDEFIGDAILAIFGAPVAKVNDAARAVACALEMQLAMAQVNLRNREAGFPPLAMGIGINTGEVIVGNIGSTRRTKYGVIGHHVNLTSRIESYTVGGQILISESTFAACGGNVRIDKQMRVMPKGVREAITIYDIGGIDGEFSVQIPVRKPAILEPLRRSLPILYTIWEDKCTQREKHSARILALSEESADVEGARECPVLSNVKILLGQNDHASESAELYGKVTEVFSVAPARFRVQFTSVPAGARQLLRDIAQM